MRKLTLIGLFICLLVSDFLWAARKHYPKRKRHRIVRKPVTIDITKTIPEILKSFFDKYLPDRTFSGAIIVAKDNDIIYERYSGWANREKNIPVTENTSFHVASVSKTFTSSAILKLVQEGKLSLEDKVVKFLPYFLYDDVKIVDLLSHRSGLKTYDHFIRSLKFPKDIFLSNRQILEVLNENPRQKFVEADKKFWYSNSNYALLALIIEEVTHMPYKEFMETKIFKPLGLTHTYIFSLEDTAYYTPSYNKNFKRETYRYLDAIVGDKGVYTSATDLLKWDSILKGMSFLNQKILQKAFLPYSKEKGGHRNYGLGWRLDTVAKYDKKLVYHFGWWHGNRAVFIRDLKKTATVIILSNKFSKNIYRIKDLITQYDLL